MKLQLYVSWLMIIRTDFRNLTSANIFLFNFDSPSIDFCKFWLLSNSFSAFSILSLRAKEDHFAAMLNQLGSSTLRTQWAALLPSFPVYDQSNCALIALIVSLAAVFSIVTQRSSPQTAAHIQTTFLSTT